MSAATMQRADLESQEAHTALFQMPLWSELRKNAALARPLIALHAGQQIMAIVDMLMLEHVSTAAVAGAGIGSSLFLAVSVLGIGLLLGLDPLIAQAVGAGESDRARAYTRRGLALALILSGPLGLLLALAPLALPGLGVPADAVRETAHFVWARIPGLPFLLLGMACRSYLQAVLLTRPIVVGVVLSSVCNLPLDLLLIFGASAALPGLGSAGAGLSNSIATAIGFVVMFSAWRRSAPSAGHVDNSIRTRSILRLGVPMAVQLLAEVFVYTLGAILIGRLGTTASAGHALAAAVATLTFSVALGIGGATTIRVAQAVGAGDLLAARRAGVAGMINAWIAMGAAAVAFYMFPEQLAGLLATQPETLAAAVPLLQVAAMFQISDGTQAVALGALRGTGDTTSGLLTNLIGHYVIGLPGAIGLGLFSPLGAVGVWIGLSIGMVFAAVHLTMRFFSRIKNPIARADHQVDAQVSEMAAAAA